MIMKNYKIMWDEHLRQIAVAKHRIDQNPLDTLPWHSVQYHTGPIQREVEREENDKMEETSVALTAVMEWASPVVFVPKNY